MPHPVPAPTVACPRTPSRRPDRRPRRTCRAASGPGGPRHVALALALATWCLAASPGAEERAGETIWTITSSGAPPRVVQHGRLPGTRGGDAEERIIVEAAGATTLRLQTEIGPAAAIDEFSATIRLRADRADVSIAARVVLPHFISRTTRRPVELLVPGDRSRGADRWETLRVRDVPTTLAGMLPAVRLEHGPEGTLAEATITHLVLELPSMPGRHAIDIGPVRIVDAIAAANSGVILAGGTAATIPPADPPAGLARGVVEVDGLPFFPRSIDHCGEPLARLATLGFNCVRLAEPASADLLAEARQAGLWVICPPPPIPDVDQRDPESMPVLRNWDRVLMWDLGTGLSEADVDAVAERGRRLRACDLRPSRPLVASADSGLRAISRHVDMVVARRTVLGTSLELADYLTWLRERPRLVRPGTPLLATLSTEIDPSAARQAAVIAGIGGRGLSVDPESLRLATLSAVAAGARGILYSSTRRIDGDDHESRLRAAAARETNLSLSTLEPWAAAGRFAASVQTSNPEVRAVVLEAARARMVIAWRCVQGAQICARRYAGALPEEGMAVTLLVPGVPEAHQAWEVAPGGLRPLRQRRATGGVAVTIDDFLSTGIVLVSGEPAVTAHVQQRLQAAAAAELASARALTSLLLADTASVLERLPPAALGNLPVAAMLGAAHRDAVEAEGLAATEPGTAIARHRRAAAICGQFERLAWERGVQGTGSLLSLMASPLSASDATLAEQWRFSEALATATPSTDLLAGGSMERIDELASQGWRHFVQPGTDLHTAVDISRDRPAAGNGCLRMLARPAKAGDPPVVVETPPVWITTPPLPAPAGKLLEISARVWVPKPIRGSVDGLMVFDSLGGPALAERVGVTRDWVRLTLYRAVPPEHEDGPLVVTFALTGLGEARIDDVSIRVLDRVPGGTPALVVSAPKEVGRTGFPAPADLLVAPAAVGTGPGPGAQPQAPPGSAASQGVQAAAPAATTRTPWPAMSLDWPQLMPFGQSGDTPPAGPGGGTIDPFKRARSAAPP